MNLSYRIHLILLGLVLAILSACAPSGVHRGTGQVIDDAAITTRVKAAFAADPEVKATQVQVETYKGTVQLSGFVDSPDSAARAARLAREVPGVKEVRNSMSVKQ
ncbi:BON domain-containing protein [Massilia sp. IC2-477]|uniref:BON domain-containing protein n=1 Tax=unclassified Massilia TaxID=2609279 RepID=UPI001D128EE4|nr:MULTISPECIES: BON domain-containing protein [unclassified Massilia]MCC2955098.1 BON domain-containing protein [Massilia sp. IC2-477]MCC2974683.1 BON domain-containing protein [Massilia sp. IC2-476]